MSQSSKPLTDLVVPGYRYLQDAALIAHCEGANNYALLHLTKLERPLLVNATTFLLTTHNAPLMVTRTLKYFEEQLPHFIRISKSLLVNPLYMDKIVAVKGRSMQVHMLDGTILNGSRRRILETTDKFTLYQEGVAARQGKPA
ncbi:LytTR family DNA-binding domain-containing protein [Fibrivirga algicola]|uniref:LytTR family transcriptional regulator n=1 Tax=Fibrivirga algicola TaxID=2950420 RepID=A0ABX0QG58_9BACT|nr:LytTR family DNA-binding domain-containing protein [Fibrivirga algicola]NID09074.1 LytTR family transcriptional regulator [Fibrivirga algicola]